MRISCGHAKRSLADAGLKRRDGWPETGPGHDANLAPGGQSLNVLEGAIDFFFRVVEVGRQADAVAGVGGKPGGGGGLELFGQLVAIDIGDVKGDEGGATLPLGRAG